MIAINWANNTSSEFASVHKTHIFKIQICIVPLHMKCSVYAIAKAGGYSMAPLLGVFFPYPHPLPVNRCSFVRPIPQHQHNLIASIVSAHIARKINGFANECFHCNDRNCGKMKKVEFKQLISIYKSGLTFLLKINTNLEWWIISFVTLGSNVYSR